ncbi:hypothetical protein POM88_011402 [Heracleum sosnowskyi]|uniref:F-box domain-containing protein n=1 Tax=Heracleum sosnowskyi TaxID=360622 RepID=A0AAD8IVE1_9APIA|nr:hypothetical protein POM88_011402 [Heracleum sosnowskyi]
MQGTDVMRSVSWSELLSDLLRDIMGRLCLTDQVRFRAVCKSWHDVSPIHTIFNSWHQSTSISSWFVHLDCTSRKPTSMIEIRLYAPFHSMSNPISTHTISLTELGIPIPSDWTNIRIFCKFSWLFISVRDREKIYFILFSPLTKTLRQLPPCLNSSVWDFEQSMSSDPESADCVFLLLDACSSRNMLTISTYRKDDVEWTVKRFRKDKRFVHCQLLPMYDKGIFYIVSPLGQLSTYDVDKNEIKSVNSSTDYDLANNYRSFNARCNLFLVNGELMFNFGSKANTRTKRYDQLNKIWIPVKRDSAIVKAQKPHSSGNMIEFLSSGCLISSLESSDMDQFMRSSPEFVFETGAKYTYERNLFFWLKPPSH